MEDKVIKFKVASDKLHTAIERLSFVVNVKFLVWMHYERNADN